MRILPLLSLAGLSLLVLASGSNGQGRSPLMSRGSMGRSAAPMVRSSPMMARPSFGLAPTSRPMPSIGSPFSPYQFGPPKLTPKPGMGLLTPKPGMGLLTPKPGMGQPFPGGPKPGGSALGGQLSLSGSNKKPPKKHYTYPSPIPGGPGGGVAGRIRPIIPTLPKSHFVGTTNIPHMPQYEVSAAVVTGRVRSLRYTSTTGRTLLGGPRVVVDIVVDRVLKGIGIRPGQGLQLVGWTNGQNRQVFLPSVNERVTAFFRPDAGGKHELVVPAGFSR